MAPALIFVGFVILVGLIIALGVRHAKTADENLTRLATNLGLTRTPSHRKFGIEFSPPAAAGNIRGRAARLYTYSTGSGKSRTTWCAFSMAPQSHGNLVFHITVQGFGSRILELFGSREIVVGDPAFDGKWFIRTNQPEFFQAALIPELRARLSAAMSDISSVRRPSFKLEAGTLVYSEAGNFANDACCTRMLALKDVMSDFTDIAEVFAQQSPSPR